MSLIISSARVGAPQGGLPPPAAGHAPVLHPQGPVSGPAAPAPEHAAQGLPPPEDRPPEGSDHLHLSTHTTLYLVYCSVSFIKCVFCLCVI